MTKKIYFLLTFLLTTIGGGNVFAAEETYNVLGDTGNNTINTASGTTTFQSSTFDFSATSSVNLSVDGGSSYWTLASDRITGNNNSASITITPSKGGLLVVNLVKNSGSNKYLYVFVNGTAQSIKEVKEDNSVITYGQNNKTGYNISGTSNVVATIEAVAGTTYRFSFENSDFNNWSFTGFTFTPAETTINISDLNYSVGLTGKSDAGLNRTVGGFDLSFTNGGSGQGIKFNGGSSFFFRTEANGTMTIAMDGNNSSISITQIVLTISSSTSYDNPASYFGVNTGSLTKNSDTQLTWTGSANSVTFTHPSASVDVNLSRIVITTTTTPSFTKITPTVTLSPSSASIKVGTADTYSPTTTSTPANFAWTWSHTDLTSTNVTYAAGNANSSDVGDAGSFTTTASSVAGTYAMSATFNGSSNPWFNSATISDAYTLTVASAVLSTPDATVQTYPYTWNFDIGSSTWGNSSTQLPASDWEGSDTYYHYFVPDSETGFKIDAIKGLRFQNIGYLGLDWSWGHVYLTGGKVIIPSVPKGMIIKINASNNGQGGSATITPTNATYSGEGTATVNSSYQDFTFVTSSVGSVTFEFSGVASIKSISVQKNDLTTFAFNNTESYYGKSEPTTSPSHSTGAFIEKTTTFKYKIGRDQLLRTRVDVAPGFTDTGIDVSNFSVSSNASAVLDASDYSLQIPTDSKIYYWNVKVKKPGTASLTYSFNGTSAYNAKNYTEMFTIEKDDPELVMISSFLIKKVGDPNFTRSITLNGLSLPVTDDNAGTVNVTYFSDNTSVATVSSTGEVTIGTTPGVANIKVTLAATDYNNKVEKSWKLIVNPESGTDPTLSWSDDVNSVSVPYNQNVTHTATVNTSQTVHYESADPSIATVDDKGVVTGKGIGTTQILAYVDPTSEYNALQISYDVEVTSAGELGGFRFEPNNGKVNNGYSITPKLVFPTIPANGVTSLKVTQIQVTEREGTSVSETLTDNAISNCDIIRVDASDDLRNNWELDGVNKVFKVNVTINGKKVGKARITVTFESDYYNTATATYDVEVTEAGTTNFSWTEGSGSPEYYTYAGDFMMLPALTGNSNGNYNYSSGAKNSSSYTEGGVSHSALHAYEYERKWDGSKFNIKWNNKNIKIGEGFPDFAIVTDGISSPGTASVFFGRGEGSNHPDTLMVFCETAGDVKLRAYDPQDHTKYRDATIHILPISNIEGGSGAATTIKSGMTYPYTWDFTTNFDMANMVGSTDQYWMPIKDNNGNPTGEYTNGYGFFNLDWADVDKDNATNDRIYKHFIIGASNTKDGYMHQFNGMMLQMKGSTSWANRIDRMRILNYDGTNNRGRLQFIGGYHTLKIHVPTTLPSSFKIFVKASGTGKLCIMGLDEKAVSGKEKSLTSDPQIYSFDNTDVSYMGSEGYILLGFDDARVDWIAMSTESKTLADFENTSYWASTYSYTKDLDLSKSHEAFPNVTAHYASAFSGQNTVTMSEIGNNAVRSGTGILLKAETTNNPGASYFIANAENVESYSAPSAISGTNYLVANPEVGTKINANTTIGETQYTNFTLAYRYKVVHAGGNIDSNYTPADDWSFYRIAPSGMTVSNKNLAYLQVPGDLYVYTSRRAGDTEANPASQELLKIVFDNGNGSETTDVNINTVTEKTADNEAWYTLQGVRVNVPTKGGIYIHRGKKIVVK